MIRLLALCVTLAAGPAWAADGPVVVSVVTPDGKPAVGAKVWVYEYSYNDAPGTEPTPLVADSGKASNQLRTSWFEGKLTGFHGASSSSALRTSFTKRSAAALRSAPLFTCAM